MIEIILKLFGIAAVVCMILFAAAGAFRNSRRLNRRIREFKAEQAEMQRQGRAIDPYRALGELYSDQTTQISGPVRSARDARRASKYEKERLKKG